jgi:amino acid adenylation domain-containing protein
MGCRFPGAQHPQEFWQLLRSGTAAIREVPADRWQLDTLYDPDPAQPGKMTSRWGGFLDHIDEFDWRAFRLLPREARLMDPQHRLLLEVAWEALEDAGLPFPDIAGSRTSVSIGIGWSDYLRLQSRDWSRLDGYTATGNATCFAANRISYMFDLKGPSIALDTGCASSLSAISLACQNLWTQVTDLALAGGVSLLLSPDSMIMASKSGLLAADGRCKTLDASADGFVNGEGAGILVLKRSSDVLPGDRVYALLLGAASSHNGHNEWIVAPSQSAQEALLCSAYRQAAVDPGLVDYIELHGTGFRRGDAIETGALGAVLGASSARSEPCLIGAVKTNIGHLGAAAGIASTMKVALALFHREIPPTLNLEQLNPAIHLQELGLEVSRVARPWPVKDSALLAGVSAFALSGANAHAVLAAAPADRAPKSDEPRKRRWRVLPLSAHTQSALLAYAAAFLQFLQEQATPRASWEDICYTASLRRTPYAARLALIARTPGEAACALQAFLENPAGAGIIVGEAPNTRAQQVTLFFSHRWRRTTRLATSFLYREPASRSLLETCEQLAAPYLQRSLRQELEAASGTWLSPLATVVLQVAQVELWRSWGIEPGAVAGDGWGELAAAYTAGVLPLAQAIQIAAGRDTECDAEERACTLPFLSSTLGFLPPGKPLAVSCWQERPGTPVPYAQMEPDEQLIAQLLPERETLVLEVGTHSALADALVAAAHRHGHRPTLLALAQREQPLEATMLEPLAVLYTRGAPINWSALSGTTGTCVSLPTFPWQRERLWSEWLDVREVSTAPESKQPQPPAVRAQALAPDLSPQETCVRCWAEVLDLEQVGLHDSFFACGGHSLLAQQLIARLQASFQIEVSLDSLLHAPTPAAFASLVEKAQAAGEQQSTPAELPAIDLAPEQRYRPFPTTDVQQAYWVGRNLATASLNVGNHGYIEVAARGLDIPRFNQAMQRLIERHEMLRAVMLEDGQQQILARVPAFAATLVDLRGKDSAEVARSLQRLRQEMDHQLLPAEHWPAFDLRIVLLDGQAPRLHLSVESLFVDAWSMHLLVQECVQLYQHPHEELPPLELSFRDYVLAEARVQETDLFQRAAHYWNERLPGLPPAPELPLNRGPLPAAPRFIHREARLEATHWQHLKQLAARAGLTPSCILLAAFSEILSTWCRHPRFSLNLSTFHRLPLHPQVNKIVGDFTSLVVLAIDHSAPTFEQRARRIQEQLWRDLEHSVYSGVRVLRELARQQGNPTAAVLPIVFTSLLIQDTASPVQAPWQETLYCVSQTPQVWIDHQVLETHGCLVFHWQVIEALFPPGLIDAMFAAYCQLLHRLATTEEVWQAACIPLLPRDQQELLARMNATAAPPADGLLHELFRQQVRQRPQQAAVVTAARTVTYAEVRYGSLLLAHQLRNAGAQPDQLVAIVMEKGWEQVVAALAILEAGAAYLPIDPGLPAERLHYLLQHGEVRLVLTQSTLAQRIAWPARIHCLCVDTIELQGLDAPELQPVQRPDNLAYVIYTSGSTGLPKGVMIDHRGAVNTILDMNARFHVDQHDRVLALSEFTFDLSVYDIFGTLAAGGTIVMPTSDAVRDPMAWIELLKKERVTIWNTVPALLKLLVEFAEEQTLDPGETLRLALLSGDWIPLTLPERLQRLQPGAQVISLGGATEASIWSIFYPVETLDPTWKSIPYGRPLTNQRFYVLNDAFEPCPVWVPGQLYIGGIGLARGYWRDEEKTRASFVLHPTTGERLYRTGDLGRYLPDGTIEFLGREDLQVKIQGYRIELGEIEATLARHPQVQDVVVAARGEALGEKSLIAYIVAHPSAQPGDSQLRHFLEERLPAYLLPSAFVHLERLPLTANGKVDRQALPAPLSRAVWQQAAPLPATPLVAEVRQILCEVLKVPALDAHTSLLEYGAISLDILRIANLLQSRLHIRLNPGQIYRFPTLDALVRHCTEVLAEKCSQPGAPQKATTPEKADEWEEGSL